MVRREISLDEESDRILSALAEKYQGDRGKALADLLQAHGIIETFVDQCEEAQRDLLLASLRFRETFRGVPRDRLS